MIACSEAIICWRLEVLEELNTLLTDGRSSFKHQQLSLRDSSWAPAIHKSLVSLFAACIASRETSRSLRELTQMILMYGLAPPAAGEHFILGTKCWSSM